jgi:hypothetical protein
VWGLVEGEKSFALTEGYNASAAGTNSPLRETVVEEVIHFLRVGVNVESVAPLGLERFSWWTQG